MRWFLFAFAAGLAYPQTEFEAASVKPTPPTGRQIQSDKNNLERPPARGVRQAKAFGNPSAAERLVMMQAMLAGRFQMKLHRESRELPVYWPALANVFSNWLERVVLDRTGLQGRYAIPEEASDSGASPFSAVQEQLGLKLESRKGPVEILVIDAAAQPSGN